MKNKTNAIIWDFDGTLYDTCPRIFASFNNNINCNYRLNIDLERMKSPILIDTKYCVDNVNRSGNKFPDVDYDITDHIELN
jgi:beta-phosphoglucomutase-like phosphatase (HAD superfamily)